MRPTGRHFNFQFHVYLPFAHCRPLRSRPSRASFSTFPFPLPFSSSPPLAPPPFRLPLNFPGRPCSSRLLPRTLGAPRAERARGRSACSSRRAEDLPCPSSPSRQLARALLPVLTPSPRWGMGPCSRCEAPAPSARPRPRPSTSLFSSPPRPESHGPSPSPRRPSPSSRT